MKILLWTTCLSATIGCTLTEELYYDGEKSVTISGRTCQNWSSKTPHVGRYLTETDHNYCRKPEDDPDPNGPWCYTTDPDVRWEYCDVGNPSNPLCTNEDVKQCLPGTLPSVRIVGGSETLPRQYPFMVSLQSYSGGHVCGGSLIGSRWVLTAAHCGNLPSVEIGRHKFDTIDSCVEKMSVRKVNIHPDWDDDELENDIALYELRTESTYPPAYPYAPDWKEWQGESKDYEKMGEVMSIAGWGTLYQDGPSPDTLQSAQLPLYDFDTCGDRYGVNLLDSQICAGYKQGQIDTCQGDSGGPLFVEGEMGSYIVGITSYGAGCARFDSPGVYTRVSKYMDWICQITDNEAQGCVAPKSPPSQQPSNFPTQRPTQEPTSRPTQEPTNFPTQRPTQEPTSRPTQEPTSSPTQQPTKFLTQHPTRLVKCEVRRGAVHGVEVVGSGESVAMEQLPCTLASLTLSACDHSDCLYPVQAETEGGVAVSLNTWPTQIGEVRLRWLPRHSCAVQKCVVLEWKSQTNVMLGSTQMEELTYFTGALADKPCYCDDACTRYKDCCYDYQVTCSIGGQILPDFYGGAPELGTMTKLTA